MIKKEDILSLNFYNYKQPFYGSNQGIRYRISKIGDKQDTQLEVTIWPEPFCYEMTAEDKKETKTFQFSENGQEEIIKWLNSKLVT
ncbi:hypothetical protein ACTQ6A_09420 [Lachnospiraceae bacterium LCP25S3_G4]